MGFIRRILFQFLHNEQVINRMSESRPIRFLARICASIFMEGKAITQDPAFKKLDPKVVKEAASGLSKELVKTLREAKEEFKKGIK